MSLDAVLQAGRLPGNENLYVLGAYDKRVTIYSQQVRAFNLAYALVKQQGLDDTSSVAIIGGGIGGITLGAALASKHISVTIMEAGPAPLWLFSGASHRWLHPHIYDWPRDGCEQEVASLPLLSWSAGYASAVVRKWLADWHSVTEHYRDHISLSVNVTHCHVGTESGDLLVSWNERFGTGHRPHTRRFDVVVLAVGYGLEVPPRECGISYWTPDDLDSLHHNPATTGRTSWLVSGTGDGGLAELFRLTIRDFRLDQVVTQWVKPTVGADTRARIFDFETSSSRHKTTAIQDFYDQLQIAPLVEKIQGALRNDTNVTLNGSSLSYYNPLAGPLNRLILSQLRHANAFQWLPGRLLSISSSQDGVNVTFENGVKEFDRAILRHGPIPAMEVSFKTLHDSMAGIRDAWRTRPEVLDINRLQLWPEGFFPAGPQTAEPPHEHRYKGLTIFVGATTADLAGARSELLTQLEADGARIVTSDDIARDAMFDVNVRQLMEEADMLISLVGLGGTEPMPAGLEDEDEAV